MARSLRRLVPTVLVAALVAGCSPSTGGTSTNYRVVVSAASAGGMSALVAAARAEGQLNLIAVPPGWANFGAITKGFTAAYGIKVAVDDPNASSADEIKAVQARGRSGSAPDAMDLEMSDALANMNLFAPYQVATWADIPPSQKEPSGFWVQDYGGYMSIGYDSSKLPAVATLQDLLQPAFKGKVALKGDPMVSGSALDSVLMASVANGGSLDDISKGVAFFHQLRVAGILVRTYATRSTITSGATQVVFDWDYLSTNHAQDIPTWSTVIPPDAVVADYFAQAINRNAPHPAAARLWEEYLYSTAGQNLLLRGHVRPVRAAAMRAQGTIDQIAFAALPQVFGDPLIVFPEQVVAARAYLASHWAAAVA